VHLALQRNINLYLQQLYLPSTLIVALSFIAFWIDYKSHPARTLLSLLSIVTITTKAEGTKSILYLFFPFNLNITYIYIHARAHCLLALLSSSTVHYVVNLAFELTLSEQQK
jgi:hypothetical protein